METCRNHFSDHAILEDVAEVSPEDVTESSVLMDDLDLSSMEILTCGRS